MGSPPMTIVVLDDQAADRESIVEALNTASARAGIYSFSDEKGLHEFLQENPIARQKSPRRPFNLIILDFNLRGTKAPAVLKMLRANAETELTPVVVFSDSPRSEDVAASYRAGANAFVSKPTDFGEFYDAVLQTAHFWLTRNQIAG